MTVVNSVEQYTIDMRFLADYFGNERLRSIFEVPMSLADWNYAMSTGYDWGELLGAYEKQRISAQFRR